MEGKNSRTVYKRGTIEGISNKLGNKSNISTNPPTQEVIQNKFENILNLKPEWSIFDDEKHIDDIELNSKGPTLSKSSNSEISSSKFHSQTNVAPHKPPTAPKLRPITKAGKVMKRLKGTPSESLQFKLLKNLGQSKNS